MNISEVIGWKFNHQPGMRCHEIDGELKITKFPGGIPSQADQDQWTQEYKDMLASKPPIKKPLTPDDLFDILILKGVVTEEDR